MPSWVLNVNPIFLTEALQQHDALGEHGVPGIAAAVLQLRVSGFGPLVVKPLTRVFASEIGRQGLLEYSAKDQIGARVFLTPSLQVAVTVPTWAREVLIDLAVAVDHQATSGLAGLMIRCSQSVAGAKAFSFTVEQPLIISNEIWTTPWRPTRARTSISSCSSSSWL